MPVTNYYSGNGEIIAEHTASQSRLDYITDGLGSVVSTINQSLTVQSTARYKPYGAELATTGAPMKFGCVGGQGYRGTGLAHSDFYVVKRHFASIDGRWTSIDLLWPYESGFGYVGASPATLYDPDGMQFAPTKPKPSPGRPIQNPNEPPTYDPPGPYPRNPSSDGSTGPWSGLSMCMKGASIVGLALYPYQLGSDTLHNLRYPHPPVEPSQEKCQHLWNAKDGVCDFPTKCTGNMRNCTVLTERFTKALNCVNRRIEYLLSCDVPGGGAKNPKYCAHAQQMCVRLTSARNCLGFLRNRCPGFGSILLDNYVNLCRQLQSQCKETDFGGDIYK